MDRATFIRQTVSSLLILAAVPTVAPAAAIELREPGLRRCPRCGWRRGQVPTSLEPWWAAPHKGCALCDFCAFCGQAISPRTAWLMPDVSLPARHAEESQMAGRRGPARVQTSSRTCA